MLLSKRNHLLVPSRLIIHCAILQPFLGLEIIPEEKRDRPKEQRDMLLLFVIFYYPFPLETDNGVIIVCSLQEAQKRMKIKKPPHILVIHLKRFKYIEQLGRYKKLSYRVVFPLELKLSNTMEDADSEYSLFAVVVHVGSGPNHGHYVSLVKSHNHWLFFDDENVEMIDESVVQTFFGSAQEYSSNTDHGYILFYESLGTGNKS